MERTVIDVGGNGLAFAPGPAPVLLFLGKPVLEIISHDSLETELHIPSVSQ
jgi:hypothetical protein